MGWFRYKCPEHGEFVVKLDRRSRTSACKVCGVESTPVLTVGDTQVLERLDNGLMARAVERLHNIEELMEKRADAHSERTKDPRESQD
jgi:hypothetical protein